MLQGAEEKSTLLLRIPERERIRGPWPNKYSINALRIQISELTKIAVNMSENSLIKPSKIKISV